LDASDEVRLAWPKLSGESGHLCKPSRPAHLRVVSRRAPVALFRKRQRSVHDPRCEEDQELVAVFSEAAALEEHAENRNVA
jgi:hypothetical protein